MHPSLNAFKATLPDSVAELQTLSIFYDATISQLLRVISSKTQFVQITALVLQDNGLQDETFFFSTPKAIPSQFTAFFHDYANQLIAENWIIQDKIQDLLSPTEKCFYE